MTALFLLLLACGGGAGDKRPAPAETADPADSAGPAPTFEGICPAEAFLGGVRVESYDDYAIVDGTIRDGVIPNTVRVLEAEEGTCRLERRLNPFCDPPCASDEACTAEGACVPFPEGQDQGTITLGGLAVPVEMVPVVPGYRYFFTGLSWPGFTAGSPVHLASTGGALPPLSLDAEGVESLALVGLTWTVTDGQDLTVNWAPPASAGPAEIVLELNIDQHGTSPLFLSCTFGDAAGAGTIPASLLSALIAHGVTGFPNGSLQRRVADRVDVESGCVDLRLASLRLPDVRVTGYTPCQFDDDCPDGQTCNEALERCE